jgi:hypothetical protein
MLLGRGVHGAEAKMAGMNWAKAGQQTHARRWGQAAASPRRSLKAALEPDGLTVSDRGMLQRLVEQEGVTGLERWRIGKMLREGEKLGGRERSWLGGVARRLGVPWGAIGGERAETDLGPRVLAPPGRSSG